MQVQRHLVRDLLLWVRRRKDRDCHIGWHTTELVSLQLGREALGADERNVRHEHGVRILLGQNPAFVDEHASGEDRPRVDRKLRGKLP